VKPFSSRFMQIFVQAVLLVLVVSIYLAFGGGILLAFLYLPLALLASRWFLPLLGALGVVVIVIAPWVPRPPVEVFLFGQAIIILVLLVSGRLERNSLTEGTAESPARVRAGKFRILAALFAFGLVLHLALFRTSTIVEEGVWIFALLAFASRLPRTARSRNTSWREITANAILLIASSALGLVLLEVSARMVVQSPPPFAPEEGGYMPDPAAIFTLRPGWTGYYPVETPREEPQYFEVAISMQGLREKELGPKQPDEFRILALGDSFTMGWRVSYEDSFPHQLEEQLNHLQLNKRITVINGGVCSYGPWQERLFFLSRGVPLEPDLVLLQVYPGNDVGNTLTKYGTHLEAYHPEWERLVLFWQSRMEFATRAQWWLQSQCRLYYALELATGRYYVESFISNSRFVTPTQTKRLGANVARPFYIEVNLDESYPELDRGWAALSEDFSALKSDCLSLGIGLVAFCLPLEQELDDEKWEETLESVRQPITYECFKNVRLCEELFRENEIPFIDVTHALRSDNVSDDIFLWDSHLNREGNAILADTLYKELVEVILPDYGIFSSANTPPVHSETTVEANPPTVNRRSLQRGKYWEQS
jgi:hypothetical protein